MLSIWSALAEMYLNVLIQYGRNPDASKQPLVEYFINGAFGVNSSTNRKDSEELVLEVGIDGLTQVVLYFWPLLYADKASLQEAVIALFRSDQYFVGFMSQFPEFKKMIPVKFAKMKISTKCTGIPKDWDVFERFPDILSGRLKLLSFINEEWTVTGVPEESLNRKHSQKESDAKKKSKKDGSSEDEEDSEIKPLKKVDRLNQSLGRIINKLRWQHTTYPVDLVAELKTFHQTVLDALFYLQTNTEVSTSYSQHVQFVLTYVNSMEVFHDLTEREIDYRTMDVADLEDEILKLKKATIEDVKTPANNESKDGENSDLDESKDDEDSHKDTSKDDEEEEVSENNDSGDDGDAGKSS